MRHVLLICASMIICGPVALAMPPPLLPAPTVSALADELSGETAKRNLEGLARFHRQRGSNGFHYAAELIVGRATAYGLSQIEIMKFPADGKISYGTQRSRQGWDAKQGDLMELIDGKSHTMASFAAEPVVLAEDSESADVTAELIDVGGGTRDEDFAGKEVRGKMVLVAAQPGDVQDMAVGKYGAVGIVSYAQNQNTAWSGENVRQIRWGHLESFSPNKTFGFMVSLETAHALQQRLRMKQTIRLHAVVDAGQHPSDYEVVTAVIPGSDDRLKAEEIAFSCHLDHQRPGANDNASGCVTILEVARTLQKLIGEGKLAAPARTIRFIWPPEVEGTLALLNARPEFAARIKAVVHMDMVGGGPETKAVFHVTRGPMSLPSFVHDIAWSFADWVNEETYRYAATGSADFPLAAPEGGKEPLRALYSAYTMGSDHDVYQDSSFGIPAIYFNDWPDRYIHTNLDSAANIDPTKLKRAAFIGAASGYFLANFSARDAEAARRAVALGKLSRLELALQRGTPAAAGEDYERGVDRSVDNFASPARAGGNATSHASASASAVRADLATVYHRSPTPKGQLMVFGYDYFTDHAKARSLAMPALLDYVGAWGGGEEYAYEALNLADGHRRVQDIVQVLEAEYGTVPPQLVVDYLSALKAIGILQ